MRGKSLKIRSADNSQDENTNDHGQILQEDVDPVPVRTKKRGNANTPVDVPLKKRVRSNGRSEDNAQYESNNDDGQTLQEDVDTDADPVPVRTKKRGNADTPVDVPLKKRVRSDVQTIEESDRSKKRPNADSTAAGASKRLISNGKLLENSPAGADGNNNRRPKRKPKQNVEQVKAALSQKLNGFKVPELSELMKNLNIKFGTGNRNKAALVETILRDPQPAVEYQCEELREIYFMRTKKHLGKLAKEKLLREVRLLLPGFKSLKREAMAGIEWLKFVNASMDFGTANKKMFETDFGFRFYTVRTDLINGNLSPNDQFRVKEEWAFVKSMPQFLFYVDSNEINEIEQMVVALDNM